MNLCSSCNSSLPSPPPSNRIRFMAIAWISQAFSPLPSLSTPSLHPLPCQLHAPTKVSPSFRCSPVGSPVTSATTLLWSSVQGSLVGDREATWGWLSLSSPPHDSNVPDSPDSPEGLQLLTAQISRRPRSCCTSRSSHWVMPPPPLPRSITFAS